MHRALEFLLDQGLMRWRSEHSYETFSIIPIVL